MKKQAEMTVEEINAQAAEKIAKRDALLKERAEMNANLNAHQAQVAAARARIARELRRLPPVPREVRRAAKAEAVRRAHDEAPCAKCASREIAGRVPKRHHAECERRGNPHAKAAA